MFVGLWASVYIHKLVAFFLHTFQYEGLCGNREGERAIFVLYGYRGAVLYGYCGTRKPLARHMFAVNHSAFGLHVTLLGLGCGREAEQYSGEE